jgi:hypothetical protein
LSLNISLKPSENSHRLPPNVDVNRREIDEIGEVMPAMSQAVKRLRDDLLIGDIVPVSDDEEPGPT